MTLIEIIVLALIQGLTEFLPISSSAHLVLPSQLLGWQDQGIAFDVAVHVGTLLAVVSYFRKEVSNMFTAWVGTLKGDRTNPDGKVAWWILLGTIPAGLTGLFGKDFIEAYARDALVIASMTIIFGLLLWWADAKAKQVKDISQLGLKGALIIGVAQAVALIPGTSRSGITMTAGLMLGLDRQSAARFSFLLSIPVIALAGGYLIVKLLMSGEAIDWVAMASGAVVAFVAAYSCIHVFLIVLEKMGMMPFVIYRLLLGVGLLWFVYG